MRVVVRPEARLRTVKPGLCYSVVPFADLHRRVRSDARDSSDV